jgi:hypothetical protein
VFNHTGRLAFSDDPPGDLTTRCSLLSSNPSICHREPGAACPTHRSLPLNRLPLIQRLLAIIVLAAVPAACDYSNEQRVTPKEIRTAQQAKSNISKHSPGQATRPTTPQSGLTDSPEQKEKRSAILSNVIQLIQKAGTSPGGKNFKIATENLNQYFEQGTKPSDYALSRASREFLANLFAPEMIREFESPKFFDTFDGRHLEDCMLYNEIATRVAGEGDDLTRVRRIFDWMVRHVQLVPPSSLAPTGFNQAPARPYDVLLRGMATEYQGFWTERGWLFMSLCRQIGIDVGLVAYTPRQPPKMLSLQPNQPEQSNPVGWICVALIGDKAYLFDQRLGITIPDATGNGVATLEEAITDPQILAQLDLPGQAPYGTTRADLVSSVGKLIVLIDSSRGYFSPKMRLLQSRLTGQNRTILFRDPAELQDHFAKALGTRLGSVKLLPLPIIVDRGLFGDGSLVEATQASLRLFDRRFPLLYARMAQLKGDIPDAITKYVAFRLNKGTLQMDKKTPIVESLQNELDVSATYFLALCQLEQGNVSLADSLFKQLLNKTPEPAPTRPYCYMFRWGATTNLGLIAKANGDVPAATRYLTQFYPPPQIQGNYWLAREFLWSDPMSLVGKPLPPAPSPADKAGDAAVMLKP